MYVVLWGIRGEKGVDKMTATKIANVSIQKMFPNPKLDKERRERVKRDIIGKTQRETITADLYLDSCAGFIFSAASNVNNFKNYLGKVALHEFNHIYQMPFFTIIREAHVLRLPGWTKSLQNCGLWSKRSKFLG